jgi:hypothetical protein
MALTTSLRKLQPAAAEFDRSILAGIALAKQHVGVKPIVHEAALPTGDDDLGMPQDAQVV